MILQGGHRAAKGIEKSQRISNISRSINAATVKLPLSGLVTMSIMRIVLLASLVCACDAQLFELEDFKAGSNWPKNGSGKTSSIKTWRDLESRFPMGCWKNGKVERVRGVLGLDVETSSKSDHWLYQKRPIGTLLLCLFN